MKDGNQELSNDYQTITVLEALGHLILECSDCSEIIADIDPNDWYAAHAKSLQRLSDATRVALAALFQARYVLRQIEVVVPASPEFLEVGNVDVIESPGGALTLLRQTHMYLPREGSERSELEQPF